ncbi:hypothetical protein MycrhN_2929 [Mycolicibacterium rhodesiae NBB3]|uniref:Uncharacterized protein n=1 Tax=Mycolicibacterium rhodesiae (strain NBB3) TaxID=710685 RepID=G8RJB5_MYCRN|nr:hypothetical protein MycrhN_2929 [Mycolicibacterium rhodesiae NBB3]
MDARNPNDGFEPIRKRIEAAGPPVDGGDTGEHGQLLTVGQEWVLIDKMANDSLKVIRNLAAADRPATLNYGPI